MGEEALFLFTNYTSEDFSWKWGGKTYTFKAGKSVYLEDFKARHFAKHLVDRELHKAGKQVDDPSRESLLAKCLTSEEASEDATTEVINKNKEMETKKPVAPKAPKESKKIPSPNSKVKTEKPKEEKEFEGLDDEEDADEPEGDK